MERPTAAVDFGEERVKSQVNEERERKRPDGHSEKSENSCSQETSYRAGRSLSDFENEVRLISNVHHRNLIRLLGCCSQGPAPLLVYE
ncbi:hypothetical protein WN943_005027 [Citrus x changshan-huyou]